MSLLSLAKKLRKFGKEEEGASGIEYAIVAAMVAVAIISFSPDIKKGVETTFTSIKNGMTTASTP
ncbi:Flp family type IVb pilin [Pseudomonas taiwanensis]|uniref:Flp family type IVb pilin n=1 Tax=Pseudomonas taiwanensis TaxID=470150 RepID=UPI0015B89295|nr:Flp family type IVb pilin [Pseudomonas taiwanensis]NWL77514.1 Flp family type IVb pilin [Pseudomonas taiwanensis]